MENEKTSTIWINQLTRGIISAGNISPLLKLVLDSCSVGNLTIIHSGQVLDLFKPYAIIEDTQIDNAIQFDFLPIMPAGLENTNGKDNRVSLLISFCLVTIDCLVRLDSRSTQRGSSTQTPATETTSTEMTFAGKRFPIRVLFDKIDWIVQTYLT